MAINIVMYQPEIPPNTGNIMRTCAATGVKLHLIHPLGFSLDEKHMRRAAMDYYQFVKYEEYLSIEEFFEKNAGGTFYFLTRYGQKPYSSFDYSNGDEEIYFIFGSESKGIPKEILRPYFDTCLRIPMNGNVRSLNVANCATVLLFEALRQQNFPGLLNEEPAADDKGFRGKDWITSD
ncbi:MAG: tRNA (cytidine(34)-2'-O)-methyltransferase [Culicoidibacterales bacterium]